ncbi:type II secretion system F family protein [Nocardioides sp.]|uniref:type II secretion system F family protein n=1 Tax=Nocardioides sp. TaxID=35761 RepID=UPI00260F5CC3|nr:type II secretion system F family protein [Nocardioides sp.]
MTGWSLLAGGAVAVALLLAGRPGGPTLVADTAAGSDPEPRPPADVRRHRAPAAVLAVVAGLTLGRAVLGPTGGVLVGLAAAAAVWTLAARGESSAERRDRRRAAADLPHLVGLVADALRSGADPVAAVRRAGAALPGPAGERLLAHTHALGLGADPAEVWRALGRDPALAPLGRALGRAHDTGTPVARVVHLLAEQLAEQARAGVEDRARQVGVRAAVPLGLCLLPAFVVLGIVPLAATLLGDLW